MTSFFPVVRTADIPPPTIDFFLGQTFAYSNDHSGTEPCLVVIGTAEDAQDPTTATEAGLARDLPPSQFIGLSPAEVSAKLGEPANRYFVIVDERSVEDDTVLLVHTMYFDEEGNEIIIKEGELPVVQSVRATGVSAQATLVALDVGSLGIEELQSIANDSERGVYGIPDLASEGPKQGGEAPRKLLGAEE
ncbi:hypothetical protein V8F20_002819 [Naviculisporaceae sp. PSN 640]